jgi:hypothetical protein
MLLSFLLFVTPGSALMFFVFRFIKANAQVSIARTDSARAGARLDAADRAVAVAEGTAREALASTRQALDTTRAIELVGKQVTSLTDYLVTRIDGEPPARRAVGRHELPGGQDLPAITGTTQDGVLP